VGAIYEASLRIGAAINRLRRDGVGTVRIHDPAANEPSA
jgi:hypothetical protein